MNHFGISQNFRNGSLLGRFAKTDKINEEKAKNDAKKDDNVKSIPSSSSVSADNIRPSAAKLSVITSRYMTRSEDHL